MLSMAVWMILFVAPLQVFIGDLHGLNTLKHQPAKIAAMEGHWENKPGEGVPLLLFGWPDMQAETTRYALAIPNLGSLILTHDPKGQFPGLKEFAPEDRPNATVVFWSFRVMVGLGMLMLLLGLWGSWLRWRGRLAQSPAFLRFALWMGPSGLLAILAGWFTTEIGRQPWVVYGVMRTKDAVSNHSALALTVTLALFVVMYFIVFGVGIRYMLKLVGRGPQAHAPPEPEDDLKHRPARPLSAAPDHLGSGAGTSARQED
jgi:cytochrome d ubiquinol oxidase subunit I